MTQPSHNSNNGSGGMSGNTLLLMHIAGELVVIGGLAVWNYKLGQRITSLEASIEKSDEIIQQLIQKVNQQDALLQRVFGQPLGQVQNPIPQNPIQPSQGQQQPLSQQPLNHNGGNKLPPNQNQQNQQQQSRVVQQQQQNVRSQKTQPQCDDNDEECKINLEFSENEELDNEIAEELNDLKKSSQNGIKKGNKKNVQSVPTKLKKKGQKKR